MDNIQLKSTENLLQFIQESPTAFHAVQSVANRLEEDYGTELQLIREAKQPIFGICAGIQLIAAAFGAKVVYMAGGRGEHGFTTMDVVKEHLQATAFEDACEHAVRNQRETCPPQGVCGIVDFI